jgi:Protein of unknown function (DUF3307)
VPWVEIFAVFVVSHAVGDYVLQTDWQATNKRGGLGGDPLRRRALVSHVSSYTLAFVPAGIWLHDLGAGGLALLAVAIFLPHLVQDDGRLLSIYVANVKGARGAATQSVFTQVDQSFHLAALFATALVVHAALP